jgi:FtsH-binding integral membrane protein
MWLSEIGAIIFFIGWVWLIFLSLRLPVSRKMKIVWVIANLVTAPLGSLVFYLINRKGLIPLALTAIGFVVLIANLIILNNKVEFEVMN